MAKKMATALTVASSTTSYQHDRPSVAYVPGCVLPVPVRQDNSAELPNCLMARRPGCGLRVPPRLIDSALVRGCFATGAGGRP